MTYMKKVLAHLTVKKPERVEAFKKGGQAFFKWAMIEQNFGELAFYTGPSYDM